MSGPWSCPVRFAEVDRSPLTLDLEPDTATLTRIGKAIGVESLGRLSAKVILSPWLDGTELRGRIDAEVTQTCGVTLEPFETPIQADFKLRLLPPGSTNAPGPSTQEVVIDPDADDPPEVLESEVIDVAAYVVEYLALEVDPFPRKPGAVFEPPEPPTVISPFAALAALRKDTPAS